MEHRITVELNAVGVKRIAAAVWGRLARISAARGATDARSLTALGR